MGYPPPPYVNCHFCNARLSLGLDRLIDMRSRGGTLLPCQACGNEDVYEAGMVRDALLLPPIEAKGTPTPPAPPSAQAEAARGLRRLGA